MKQNIIYVVSVVVLIGLYVILFHLHNTTVGLLLVCWEGACVALTSARIATWLSNQFGEDNGYREEDQESHSDTEEPGDSNSL